MYPATGELYIRAEYNVNACDKEFLFIYYKAWKHLPKK